MKRCFVCEDYFHIKSMYKIVRESVLGSVSETTNICKRCAKQKAKNLLESYIKEHYK